LKISSEAIDELLRVNADDWQPELADAKQFFDKFGDRLPREVMDEHRRLAQRFQRTVSA
jgi:GTP-dependent phosphoenolpyruvate carboxykinase